MARALGKAWKAEVSVKIHFKPKEFYIVARRNMVAVYYHAPGCYSADHQHFSRGPEFETTPLRALHKLKLFLEARYAEIQAALFDVTDTPSL